MAEIMLIGLSLGSILLLVALGLAIIYGSMGVINMSHGEMVMLGAYVAALMSIHTSLNLVAAIPVAFVVTAGIGYLVERGVVQFLYGRLLDTLLATWGVALILQQLIRIEFGAIYFGFSIDGLGRGLQNVPIPDFLRLAYMVGDIPIPIYRIMIFGVTAFLLLFTWWLFTRTSFGRQLRAVTRNRQMAAACGINDKKINSLAFAYGCGLAGVAGVLVSGIASVSPSMGTPYVIEAFLVVVAGGVGSLLGTVVSALGLGQIHAFVAAVGGDVYGKVALFLVVILIILFRPQGLFPERKR